MDMRFIINGQPYNLRTLSSMELDSLIKSTEARQERLQEELDSLVGELLRRHNNVIPIKFARLKRKG